MVAAVSAIQGDVEALPSDADLGPKAVGWVDEGRRVVGLFVCHVFEPGERVEPDVDLG